jgi:glycosyltransferase involved in cell wall biosynthesis
LRVLEDTVLGVLERAELAGEEAMMLGRPSFISVVIAAFNEEEGIGPTLEELKKVLGEPHLIVIDGSSTDRTVEIAENMGAHVILQERKGKGDAMFQGLRRLRSSVRYVVFTDADFTYPAEYVPKMVEVLEVFPSVGMVIGNRFNGIHSFDRSIKHPFYVGNRLLAFAQHMLNGIKLDDPLSGLRVVRAEILKGWKPKSKGFDIEAEMNFHVERRGYQIVEMPIGYRPRLGEKKLKLRHGFAILRRIVAESLFA